MAKSAKKDNDGFSDVEKAAMKQRARELKAEERLNKNRAEGENDVLGAIAEMQESDRAIATRLHEIMSTHAPMLAPRLWYGMPAYTKEGKVLCFFQSGQKFGTRYATFGFNDIANLDDGTMWPTGFALMTLGDDEAKKIEALVKQAIS